MGVLEFGSQENLIMLVKYTGHKYPLVDIIQYYFCDTQYQYKYNIGKLRNF